MSLPEHWVKCHYCGRFHWKNFPCLIQQQKLEAISFPCFWITKFYHDGWPQYAPYVIWAAEGDFEDLQQMTEMFDRVAEHRVRNYMDMCFQRITKNNRSRIYEVVRV